MKAYEGFETVDVGGHGVEGWDERKDGGGTFLGAHVEVREQDGMDGLDGEGLGDLLADAPCHLGRLEGVMDPATKGLSWMGRSIIGATVAPTGRGVSFPVPAAVARKVSEVIQGGFVGGAIGKAGALVRTRYLKRGKLFGKLNDLAAKAGMSSVAILRRNQANKVMALMIVDRLAIERLRYASVLKIHQVLKSVESDFHVQEAAASSDPLARRRHLAAAKAASILATMQAAAAKALLGQRIRFPELDRTVAHLSKVRTAADFGPEAKAESQRKRLRLPASRRTSFHPPNPAALYNHFGTVEDGSELEGCDDWDVWCKTKKISGDAYDYGKKGLKKLDGAVDWADDKLADANDILETTAAVMTTAGSIIALVPIIPIAQAVGGAMMAAGAGVGAAAEATGAAKKITGTIKGEKDKAKKVLKAGDDLLSGKKKKKAVTAEGSETSKTVSMPGPSAPGKAAMPGPSMSGKAAAKPAKKPKRKKAKKARFTAEELATAKKDLQIKLIQAREEQAKDKLKKSNMALYAGIAAGGIAIVGVGVVLGRRRQPTA